MLTPLSRKSFLLRLGASLALANSQRPPSLLAAEPTAHPTRFVFAMSDLHIGNAHDGLDGSDSLALAFDDLRHHAIGPISYGLMLGDVSQHGDRASVEKYVALRNAGPVPHWFELAGNHDHNNSGIAHFEALVRSTAPHLFLDGNIAWIFLSDEKSSRQGEITPETLKWLSQTLGELDGKNVIVCSHQLVADTVRHSDEDSYCLFPKEKVVDLLQRFPVDLWLCGHEHHGPYSRACCSRKGNTTFLNIASMSRLYNTGASESFVLELADGARELVARRRNHETASYVPAFEFRIPLRHPITCAPRL